MKKQIITPNGSEVVDMTAEEITADEARVAAATTEATNEANAKKTKDDLKASAKAKLIAGQALTEDEANTIVL